MALVLANYGHFSYRLFRLHDILRQTLSLGCHIHNGTYVMLSMTLTIMLTLPTLLTLILGTAVNISP